MANAAEKVRPIGHQNIEEAEMQSSMQEEIMGKSQKDMGKAAIFIAILAVILMVIFFFGINQNITGMAHELKELSSVKTDVLLMKNQIGGIEGQMGTMNGKIAELQKLPQQTKKMVLGSMLQEMAQRANFLSSQMESEEETAKLQQAMELLNQVQTEVAPR